MSEPVAKHRPMTDFEEFERLMHESVRPQAQRPAGGDPLAELARLVGTSHDPYQDVFAREAARAEPPSHAAAGRPGIDFLAIEAGLRGSLPGHSAAPHPAYEDATQDAYADHQAAGADGSVAGWQEQAPAAPSSRRPVYVMAAVICAGILGVGLAFAYKGSGSGPREVAMIKAAPGPTKIQPPADGSADQTTRDASILDKGQQPAPTKLVSRQEQPVDLAEAVQNAPPRDSGLSPLYNLGKGGGDAASVPVPESPNQARQDRSTVAGDIEPIRVKTRSYRPDGTPIPDDQPPAAAASSAPSAGAPKVDKAPVAKASTPKSAAPKTTTRIASTPKPIVTAAREDAAPVDLSPTPAASSAAARKAPAKPAKVASVTDAAGDAAETAGAGGGGFAVQLAAPGTEPEARQVSSKLSQKFSAALSGHRLSFHQATSNGKSVYRVRVGSLSREEAVSLCEKLKSSGGSCFVAKN